MWVKIRPSAHKRFTHATLSTLQVRFGDEVRGSITLNLPDGSWLGDTAKLLMAVAILFTYGLQFYV